mmetsp:Transcript_30700/g.94989  ORF Transcript_30700/g.94989 Transcript_30700/m.94989 type:complete len:105 (-) Transcript_30700:467-781(-)
MMQSASRFKLKARPLEQGTTVFLRNDNSLNRPQVMKRAWLEGKNLMILCDKHMATGQTPGDPVLDKIWKGIFFASPALMQERKIVEMKNLVKETIIAYGSSSLA